MIFEVGVFVLGWVEYVRRNMPEVIRGRDELISAYAVWLTMLISC